MGYLWRSRARGDHREGCLESVTCRQLLHLTVTSKGGPPRGPPRGAQGGADGRAFFEAGGGKPQAVRGLTYRVTPPFATVWQTVLRTVRSRRAPWSGRDRSRRVR